MHKWCKTCQIKYLKENFTNLTSGNEKIDDLIQEKQSEINNSQDIVFEWIPYNQFNSIKEADKDDLSTVYLAKWKNGPLYWRNKKYIRESADEEVALEYLHNLQNIDEFLNNV